MRGLTTAVKLLLIHNYYQQRGGEDTVFEGEGRLLAEHGHTVLLYTARNQEVSTIPPVVLAKNTVWNHAVYREVGALIARERPDVVHVHNTLPLISPAVYYAARTADVPVVQTLHNYRLLCPRASFFRDGGVCEECLHARVPAPAIRHACYRGSRAATAAIAAMLVLHRGLGTWTDVVDLFISLSEFARDKMIAGGLPADKVIVKPNFSPDPGIRAGQGDYALFVGRLSEEKGLDILLKAWAALNVPIPLRVIGAGEWAEQVERVAQASAMVEWLGRRSPSEVSEAMAGARFLVFPSVWYEAFPLTIVEAFAVGLPVIASRLGSMTHLIRDQVTGLHFRPGDPSDLVEKVRWAWSHPDDMRCMGANARQEYEEKYTPERNYSLLIKAYEGALGSAHGAGNTPIGRGPGTRLATFLKARGAS
jgi:glycosyltransferase involved in cell wall biosynthesis